MRDIKQHNCDVFKEAWRKVKGEKCSFWGAAVLLTLISLGGFSILGLIILFGQAVFSPHFIPLLIKNPLMILNTSITLSVGFLGTMLVYHIGQSLFEMFVLLPMRMGMRLIPLRQVAEKPVHALYVFKFFKWDYIWRFILLEVLLLIAIGIPGALGILAFCAPHTYHFSLALKVVSYAVGVLLYLLVLYQLVGYAFVNLLIIDRKVQPLAAMKLSLTAINKRWFCVFGILIVLGLALFVGAALLLVGLIWAAPFVQNAIAILYRDMLGIEGHDPATLKELRG